MHQGANQHGLRTAAIAGAALLSVALFVFLLISPQSKVEPKPADVESKPFIVGLSVANHGESRWEVETAIMAEEAKKHGITLLTAVADSDPDVQEAQARSMLAQGAKVLIVVASDSEKAGAIVNEAHKTGAKVIAYDRLIRNVDLDYYLSFSNEKVGELEAQGVLNAMGGKGKVAYVGGSPTDNNAYLVRNGSFGVLQPKVDAGEVQIVFDRQIADWSADVAYRTFSDFLKKGGKVDGVVAANDSTAGGVIKALREYGLAGKVPVSGQDAELRACRDILSGEQTMTVYKPLKLLAVEAVRMAVAAAAGQAVETSVTVQNGKAEVPSRLLDVVEVTKANMEETVVADGLHTHEEIYGPDNESPQ